MTDPSKVPADVSARHVMKVPGDFRFLGALERLIMENANAKLWKCLWADELCPSHLASVDLWIWIVPRFGTMSSKRPPFWTN